MGTRTAIFQQQTDGTYIGIYVHLDGYIEGVGKTLFEHYQNRLKVWELIKAKKPLHCLGTTTNKISQKAFSDKLKISFEEANKYCIEGVSRFNEQEYYIANSVDEIQSETYFTYDKGEIQGYEVGAVNKKQFLPYRGSDNNGFLYYQDLSGSWYVSQLEAKKNKDYRMSVFKPLSNILKSY